MLCAIFLRLAPAATANLSRPGVMDAVAEAARGGSAPSVAALTALGQPEEFARLFVERLAYLLRLREAGILRGAGPFADLKDGMYLCNVPDEREAHRIMEADPFLRTGLIEPDYAIRRWLAAV
ncbi:MAG TPA: YciI family protein [Candidatus Sulfotelmatobacter sp.]|nr:YciI family protein [Candidatus Sulfotelmatobacter sp.]